MEDLALGSPRNHGESESLEELRTGILRDLKTVFVHPYVKLFQKILGPSLTGLLVGSLLIALVVHSMVWVLEAWDHVIFNKWSLLFLPLLVFADFFLPSAGYKAVVNAAPQLLQLPANFDGLESIRARLRTMYIGRGQWVMSSVVALVMLATLLALRKEQWLPQPFQQVSITVWAIGSALVVFAGFVGGWGIWSICTMLYLVAGFKELSGWTRQGTNEVCGLLLNPITPSETVGLRSLLHVAGIYSFYYSLGVVVLGIPLLAMPWPRDKGLFFILLVYPIPVLITAVLAFSLLYPVWVYSSILADARDHGLLKLESQMRSLVPMGTTRSGAAEISALLSLQKELLHSTRGLPRVSDFLRMISTLILQVAFAVQWLQKWGIRSFADLADKLRAWFSAGP